MLSPVDETTSIDENERSVYRSNSTEQNASNIFSDANDLNKNQRSVVINEAQPLARCSVLYLGTAIPSADEYGIVSVQEPLSKRYPVDGTEVVRGIEAWLSIDENGLQIQFSKDPSVIVYYPIRSLAYCATIRFITSDKSPNGWRFVPLDHPEATLAENTQHPPLFVVNFHRTRHLPMEECHCFVAKTKQTALALVKACYNAYQATDVEQNCSKVPLYFKISDDGLHVKEIDNEIRIVPALDEEKILDYQINKKAAGFFYKTDQVPIDYWHLWEQNQHDIQRSSSNHSFKSSHRQHRLASVTSIPDNQRTVEPQSTNNSTDESSKLMVDPYAPDPNVIRVERIKDIHSGQYVFIRWLRDPLEVFEQVSTIQKPNYDYQSEEKLPNKIQDLVLNDDVVKKSVIFDDKPQSIPIYHEHKKSKIKKQKHRHEKNRSAKKNHRHKYHEIGNSYVPPSIQPSFMLPSYTMSFRTIELPSQHNTTPFWFYTM